MQKNGFVIFDGGKIVEDIGVDVIGMIDVLDGPTVVVTGANVVVDRFSITVEIIGSNVEDREAIELFTKVSSMTDMSQNGDLHKNFRFINQ